MINLCGSQCFILSTTCIPKQLQQVWKGCVEHSLPIASIDMVAPVVQVQQRIAKGSLKSQRRVTCLPSICKAIHGVKSRSCFFVDVPGSGWALINDIRWSSRWLQKTIDIPRMDATHTDGVCDFHRHPSPVEWPLFHRDKQRGTDARLQVFHRSAFFAAQVSSQNLVA